MPTPTPEQLSAARVASGRLGGRPKKPTLAEARERALAELEPRAMAVLREHLDRGGADAWRAALTIFSHRYGRPQDHVVVDTGAPDIVADLRALSSDDLARLRERFAMPSTPRDE